MFIRLIDIDIRRRRRDDRVIVHYARGDVDSQSRLARIAIAVSNAVIEKIRSNRAGIGRITITAIYVNGERSEITMNRSWAGNNIFKWRAICGMIQMTNEINRTGNIIRA